ncbi:hypothetical protein RSAG8_08584, partial [Rhizoctonia solani AG-8 WAC10335]
MQRPEQLSRPHPIHILSKSGLAHLTGLLFIQHPSTVLCSSSANVHRLRLKWARCPGRVYNLYQSIGVIIGTYRNIIHTALSEV